jgi:hypothetical protein
MDIARIMKRAFFIGGELLIVWFDLDPRNSSEEALVCADTASAFTPEREMQVIGWKRD